jgi:hypothetical protein
MQLWTAWVDAVLPMRKAFSRERTFLWFLTILIAFSIRSDLIGVTSFVRALSLFPQTYPLLLNTLHSSANRLSQLRFIWTHHCLKIFSPFLVQFNNRIVLIADGIKNPKEGRKMPGIKSCHQESTNNSKPEYVMAHSCQTICLLVQGVLTFFAVPLACEIHEGVVFSNGDKRTLYDKLILLLNQLNLMRSFYFVADAYYATRKIAFSLLKQGQHLVSRVRSNAVAYFPYISDPSQKKRRGRPTFYGSKVKLKSIFEKIADFTMISSPFLDDKNVQIQIFTQDLIWRSIGKLVRFVWVIHPTRGRWILMTTDTTLTAIQVVQLYGMRFRIELAFKQAIYLVGAFGYHLWMKGMDRIKKCSSGQFLHHKSDQYRKQVIRKMRAYEIYIQYGLIALGLMQYLALKYPLQVFKEFRGWYRTLNTNKTPSEAVVANALQNTCPEFLMNLPKTHIIKKFLINKISWLYYSAKKVAA